jgi:AraC-like DNA-binding protein
LYERLDIPNEYPVAWGINAYETTTEPHFDLHAGLELGIVLEGMSRRIYEGYEFRAEPGQMWFAGLWEPHGFAVVRPRTRHLVLGFLPEFLEAGEFCDWMASFNLPPAERPQARTAADRKLVLEMAARVRELMEQRPRYWLARLRLMVQELLLHFMEQRQVAASERAPAARPGREELLPVLLMVEKFPQRAITLEEAARAVHMGRSKFAAAFHLAMGVPFAKYLQRRRLAGVIRDLRRTNEKLSVLAERWGFTDGPHLVKVFRSVVGRTPKVYQEESALNLSRLSS